MFNNRSGRPRWRWPPPRSGWPTGDLHTFPSLSGISLTLAYGLYATFAALAFVFVYRAVQETRGRTLEEM